MSMRFETVEQYEELLSDPNYEPDDEIAFLEAEKELFDRVLADENGYKQFSRITPEALLELRKLNELLLKWKDEPVIHGVIEVTDLVGGPGGKAKKMEAAVLKMEKTVLFFKSAKGKEILALIDELKADGVDVMGTLREILKEVRPS